MTQIETIIAEIERLKIEKRKENLPFHALYYDGYDAACDKIIAYLNSLPVEQPSEEVNKEIDRFIAENVGKTITVGQVAHYFANWLKQQMMKSAIDAKIVNDESSGCVVDCAQGCLVLEPHTYPIGQRLKIIIVKEDEQ